MRINKIVSDSYQVKHDMSRLSSDNNIIIARGTLPPTTITALLSSHVEDNVSSGLVSYVSSSSSSDEDSDSPVKVVTRREMILALIARSEVEEGGKDPESVETNNNDIEGDHQHQGSSTASDVQGVDEEDKSVNHEAAKLKKRSWGSYLKFLTPIDQAKARCDLCNKIYSRRFIRRHIKKFHKK